MDRFSVGEVFTKNDMARATVRKYAKKYEIVPYECGMCGNEGKWQGKEIALELHHKNGDNSDHTPQNIMFVCPNCHATTDTWKRKKKRE